jgi:hypothetical protein
LLDPARDPVAAGAPPRASRVPPRRGPSVRRLPPLEPPYDDELPEGHVRLVGQPELPFDEPQPRRFEHDIDFFDPQPTPRRDLPEPEPWATRFVRALLETVAGSRPPGQLQDWTSAEVYAQVLRAAQDRRWSGRTGAVPTVRSVHAGEPADGVAEVCAVVQRGRRFMAVAARLEGFDGRWRCVALHLG